MNDNELIKLMSHALDLYGGTAAANENKDKMLKQVIIDSLSIQNIGVLHVREAIIKNGEILDINDDTHVFVASINSGIMNAGHALVVIRLSDNKIDFAAYAKEGLIKQNLAKKAIEAIKSELSLAQ